MRNGNVIINGNSVTIRGNGNVAIVNGKIFVNGEDVTPDSKEINIVVEGDVNSLSVDVCSKVSIKGNVGAVDTASGAVEIVGDVSGNVKSVSGDIICQKVGGNIKTTSGNIISR